jgi:uncharacterized protein YfdQ (DUF2303 family)
VPFAFLGKNQGTESLEKFLDKLLTIKENRKFDDLRGFIEYIKLFQSDKTIAFVNRQRVQIVFDYHKKDTASWCNHAIEYNYIRSNRWTLWEKANNKWLSQEEFADFLDTGLNEIAAPTQSEVLSLAKDFRATINAAVDSKIDAGGTSFNYSEEVKGGSKTNIEIPEYIKIQVSPFDNLQILNDIIKSDDNKIPVYEFSAKLSWKICLQNGNKKPQFKLKLINFENAVDETLENLQNAIKDLTSLPTIIGG